jgi:hypothetical protein
MQSGIDKLGWSSSAEECARIADATKEAFPALMKDLQSDQGAILVKSELLANAYCGELPVQVATEAFEGEAIVAPSSNDYVKIVIGNMASLPLCDYVDCNMDVLLRQTNTTSATHACAILDTAFACSAVNMLVCYDPRWANKGGSPYRGFPVIDTEKFFAILKDVRSMEDGYVNVATRNKGVLQYDEAGDEILYKVMLHKEDNDDDDGDQEILPQILTLPMGVAFDDGLLQLSIKITEENTSTIRGYKTAPPNAALSMCGLGIASSKAYAFAIGVVCKNPADNVPGMVQGFVNRGFTGGGGVSKKRKAVKMQM